MVKGNVTQIWQEERKVKIGEVWFSLAEHVKLNYIKVGPSSYTINPQLPTEISFIKSEGGTTYPPAQPPVAPPVSPPQSMPVAENYKPVDDRQEKIVKQMSVKAAIDMIKIQNALDGDKMSPTRSNIMDTAIIVKGIIDDTSW